MVKIEQNHFPSFINLEKVTFCLHVRTCFCFWFSSSLTQKEANWALSFLKIPWCQFHGIPSTRNPPPAQVGHTFSHLKGNKKLSSPTCQLALGEKNYSTNLPWHNMWWGRGECELCWPVLRNWNRKTETFFRAEQQLRWNGWSQQHTLWKIKKWSDRNMLSVPWSQEIIKGNFVKVQEACPNCLAAWRTVLEPRNPPLPRPRVPLPAAGSYDSWEVEGAEDREQLYTKKNFLITVPTQNELGCLRRAWVLHPRRHSDRGEMPTKQKYHRMVSG